MEVLCLIQLICNSTSQQPDQSSSSTPLPTLLPTTVYSRQIIHWLCSTLPSSSCAKSEYHGSTLCLIINNCISCRAKIGLASVYIILSMDSQTDSTDCTLQLAMSQLEKWADEKVQVGTPQSVFNLVKALPVIRELHRLDFTLDDICEANQKKLMKIADVYVGSLASFLRQPDTKSMHAYLEKQRIAFSQLNSKTDLDELNEITFKFIKQSGLMFQVYLSEIHAPAQGRQLFTKVIDYQQRVLQDFLYCLKSRNFELNYPSEQSVPKKQEKQLKPEEEKKEKRPMIEKSRAENLKKSFAEVDQGIVTLRAAMQNEQREMEEEIAEMKRMAGDLNKGLSATINVTPKRDRPV